MTIYNKTSSRVMRRDSLDLNKIETNEKVLNRQLTKITEMRTCMENENESPEHITKDNIFSHIVVSIFSTCFSLMCIFLMETTNLIFIGNSKISQTSNLLVDSVGLGNIYLNFIGVLIGFGILGGLDTMGSHAYGLYQFEQLGVYTVRTRIILIVIFFCITLPLGYFSHNILLFININEELALSSSSYIYYMLPTVLLTFNFNLNLRYLQVMQIYLVTSVITITGLLVHIVICYICVFNYEMGLMGLTMASFITMSYCFIFSTAYIIISNPLPRSLFIIPPPSTFDDKEFIEYFKLCFYSGVQHYGDYIGYEIVCLMCTYLDESSMAATLIVLNFANVIGYIYVGFSFPLAHMIGLFLGRKDFEMYHYTIKLFTIINFITAISLSLIVFFFSSYISNFYLDNQIAAEKASSIFLMWTVGVFCDVFNIMFQAILRGAGKQKVTSIWNLIMSFFFMTPVSYLLCFVFSFDLLGIWLGCISYTVILAFINFCYFIFLDYKQAAEIIHNQLQEENEIKINSAICYTELEEIAGDYDDL